MFALAVSVAGCDLQEREAVVPQGSVAVTVVTGGGALFVGNEHARTRSGDVVYGCYAATPTATGGHDLSRARLAFPESVLARAEGRQLVVMFMTDKALGGERRQPGLNSSRPHPSVYSRGIGVRSPFAAYDRL